MSNVDTRQALADAASSVEGVSCSPYFTQTTRAGDAMVRLDHVDYPNPFGGVVTWQVAVVLPQDTGLAERFTDSHVPALVAALGEQMVVQRVTPAQLALETGSLPVLFIEGIREENS